MTQFGKSEDNMSSLADFNLPKDVYAAGRLDKDSEGLLLLTNDGALINKITSPQFNKEKVYWAQVENIPDEKALEKFANGIEIQGQKTKKAKIKIIDDPLIPNRVPPIRERKTIPTCWLEITLTEGRNRQVRKMTAAIGCPTLRLIRQSISKLKLENLQPGQYREVELKDIF